MVAVGAILDFYAVGWYESPSFEAAASSKIQVATPRSPVAGKDTTVSVGSAMARRMPSDLPAGYLSETPQAATIVATI